MTFIRHILTHLRDWYKPAAADTPAPAHWTLHPLLNVDDPGVKKRA